MRILAGILLLIVGVSYPVAILVWLNQRLSHQPGLAPRQVGQILAFNGIFPITLIALGLGFLIPRLWAGLAYKTVLVFTALTALVLLVMLWRGSVIGRRKGDDHDRGTAGPGL